MAYIEDLVQELNYEDYFKDTIGIYEYCGVQRTGKTTLMVADLLCKLLNPYAGYDYKPSEVYANFTIKVDGINCINNQAMLQVLMRAKNEKWRHKIYVIDECSQPPLFYARNTRDRLQTELVTSLWQVPKLDSVVLYSCNIGNSVDIQQRDATWFTVMPMKIYRDREGLPCKIDYRVISGYELWYQDYTFLAVREIQKMFDSREPVI